MFLSYTKAFGFRIELALFAMLEWLFGKPEINRFEELKDKVEFGLAVVIMANELPKEFFSGLTTRQWLSFWIESSRKDSQAILLFGRKLSEQVKTFEFWQSIFDEFKETSPTYWPNYNQVPIIALQKTSDQAKTFKQWYWIYSNSKGWSATIYSIALQKMYNLAKTPTELEAVYNLIGSAPENAGIRNEILRKIKEYK